MKKIKSLTIQQFAKLKGVGREAVSRAISDGRIKAISAKVGISYFKLIPFTKKNLDFHFLTRAEAGRIGGLSRKK